MRNVEEMAKLLDKNLWGEFTIIQLYFAHCNANGWRRFTDENGRVYTPEELSEKFADAPVPRLLRYNHVWWYEAM